MITKILPPMIIDEERAAKIEVSVETTETVLNSVVMILVVVSLSQLWGMIRALQMIILSSLIEVPIPAETLIFF